MVEIAQGWDLVVDVSPEWLFMRLCVSGENLEPHPPLAERMWELAEENSVVRIVFELGDDVVLTSHVVGQLVLVHKRSYEVGGLLRICGFSDWNYAVLQVRQLADRFPNYGTREDAVMGRRPSG